MIAAPLIDYESLLDELWRRDLPDLPAMTELDTQANDTFPALRYSVIGDGQTGNGPGLFNAVLTWTVFGPPSEAWDAMAASYSAVHSWPLGDVTSHGWVQLVTDTALPARSPSPDLTVKSITQYAATVALVLRN